MVQLVSRHSCVADRLPVVVRFPAGPRGRFKTVDPPKGTGLGQKMYKDNKKNKAKFPKLRAKAGDARGLVHFSLLQCQELLSVDDPVEAFIIHRAKHLGTCYSNLSKQNLEAHVLQKAARFATLYVSLNV